MPCPGAALHNSDYGRFPRRNLLACPIFDEKGGPLDIHRRGDVKVGPAMC